MGYRKPYILLLEINRNVEELCLLGCHAVWLLLRTTTTRATRRDIPEDTILHSHRRENLKSYNCNVILPMRK
jgi:hypothetical protein